MQKDNFWVGFALIMAIAAVMSVTVVYYASIEDGVTYDCRLAEISVDYPVQVKEKCRRLSHESR